MCVSIRCCLFISRPFLELAMQMRSAINAELWSLCGKCGGGLVFDACCLLLFAGLIVLAADMKLA